MKVKLAPIACFSALLVLSACATQPEAPDRGRSAGVTDMDAARLKRLGKKFQEAGEWQTSMQFYSQAVQEDPKDPDIHAAIGRNFFEMRARDAARQSLERALALDPYHDEALITLAALSIGDHAPQKTLELLDRLHKKGRGTAQSYNLAAIAHDLMGQPLMARKAYAEGLVRSPDNPDIMSNMALSLAISGEFDAAKDILGSLSERASAANKNEGGAPSNAAQENLALVVAMEGNAEEAGLIASQVMSVGQVKVNQPFYDRLAYLAPQDRAQAVFLGQLPQQEDSVAEAIIAEDTEEEAKTADQDAAVVVVELADDLGTQETPPISSANLEDMATVSDKVDQTLVKQDRAGPEQMAEAPIAPTPSAADESVIDTTDEETGDEEIPGYHLQLGSFSSEARLQRGWESVKSLKVLSSFVPLFEQARSNDGEEVWRLLIGPVSGYSAGRDICDVLQKAKAACVVLPEKSDVETLALED
ncbi:hypothetical protein GCM10007972_04520 [Iodidimonas muriae]|uniref:SPOR domain-containing protein n=1 Tax=Iodidimonas muriae TaxID=261467 RepID=A0ABQ2L7Y4_9PROT|nr:SPOR domain-containing protein [Iodidimonas muriae]GER08166.1 hypothetical protein JCM17843_24760 [Kordiimonadales bacterium JCM 17843]GGO06305.1 hypothetical protein GCM10007972_04520 [Iodidimonas muriae]